MKKVISILLLLTFCTVQVALAGEVIIIGSNEQSRYEDKNKNIPISQNNIQNIKKKDILNEVIIKDDTGKMRICRFNTKFNKNKIKM